MKLDRARVAGWALALACFAAGLVRTGFAAPAGYPPGSEVIHVLNLEGVLLLDARLAGARRDTTGLLVLDTGAGYLALDSELAFRLGILDQPPAESAEVGLAVRPLRRVEIGSRQVDLVSPVLTVDAAIIRRVTDLPVLGLVGHSLFREHALRVDFADSTLAIIPVADTAPPGERHSFGAPEGPRRSDPAAVPPREWRGRTRSSRRALGAALGASAMPVPFELEADGKIVVSARFADRDRPKWSGRLELIVDTGATKTVLFAPALARAVRHAQRWPRLEGLSAPTLFGAEDAAMVRVPQVALRLPSGSVRQDSVDAAMLKGGLGALLTRATGRTIHGLLGYSFLRHFTVVIDYPHRVLWLERRPASGEARFEYSHPGLQVERAAGEVRVVAVARPSPAAEAGIEAGDLLVAVDGVPVASLGLIELTRRLEGEPGSAVELVLRRGEREQRYRIVRRQLL